MESDSQPSRGLPRWVIGFLLLAMGLATTTCTSSMLDEESGRVEARGDTQAIQLSGLDKLPSPTTTPPTTSAPVVTTSTTTSTVRVAPTTTTSQATPPPAAVAPTSGHNWDAVAECESGGNWSINTGNGYYGGLQFDLQTWRGTGGTGYPHEHSREEQIHRAEILWSQRGIQPWPNCGKYLYT